MTIEIYLNNSAHIKSNIFNTIWFKNVFFLKLFIRHRITSNIIYITTFVTQYSTKQIKIINKIFVLYFSDFNGNASSYQISFTKKQFANSIKNSLSTYQSERAKMPFFRRMYGFLLILDRSHDIQILQFSVILKATQLKSYIIISFSFQFWVCWQLNRTKISSKSHFSVHFVVVHSGTWCQCP